MKLKTAIVVAILAVFALFSAAAAHEGHKAEHKHHYPTATFDMVKGKALYNQYCASCHGTGGGGDGPAAMVLKPRPTDFLDMAYMSMRSRVDHYESIVKGRPGTAMPAWKATLSEADVWNVIAYIEHLFNHQTEANHEPDGHGSPDKHEGGHGRKAH